MITTPQHILHVILTFCVISSVLLAAYFVCGELIPIPVALLLAALLLTWVWPLPEPNTMVFNTDPVCTKQIQELTAKLGPDKRPADTVRTGLAIMKLWTDGHLELYITPTGLELEKSNPNLKPEQQQQQQQQQQP